MTDPTQDDPLRFAFAKAFEDARPGEDCPGADQLWGALHGVSSVPERLLIVDHLSLCPVCAEAWRLGQKAHALTEAAV